MSGSYQTKLTHLPNGTWVETELCVGPHRTIMERRRTWLEVGRAYRVEPLQHGVVNQKKTPVEGILLSFDGKHGELDPTSKRFRKSILVRLRDLVASGAADAFRLSAFHRVKSRSTASSRTVERSAERIEDDKVENVAAAVRELHAPVRPKRRKRTHLCEVCRECCCALRFKVCFECWTAQGRPNRKAVDAWIRDVWRERRGEVPPEAPQVHESFLRRETRPRFSSEVE